MRGAELCCQSMSVHCESCDCLFRTLTWELLSQDECLSSKIWLIKLAVSIYFPGVLSTKKVQYGT